MNIRKGFIGLLAAAAISLIGTASSLAYEVSVPNYGSSVSAMPWAVALTNGYFKDFKADISGVYSTQGGTSDVRAMMAGELPYAETGLGALFQANANGADLRIVSLNVVTTANFVWVTRPDSTIKELADLKGKKITFTSPHSTTDTLDSLLLKKAGLTKQDVQLISTGTYGAALTALDNGAVDVVLLAEPNYTMSKGKVKPLWWVRDVLPIINSTIGVAPAKILKDNPELIRGILAGRRKAVAYMTSNRDESATAIAKVYKLDKGLISTVMNELLDNPSEGNVPFWGDGRIYPASLDNLQDALKASGDIPQDSDWRTLVDQDFLPADLKTQLK